MADTEIPAVIARALRQIKAHERVQDVVVLETSENSVAVEVYVSSNLPSRWLAAGTSPNGVRSVEPVRFEFTNAYPVIAPDIRLRQDFDRSHPHIQPGSSDSLPQPCILMGSLDELLRSRGVNGLLDQTALWLENASMVNLIDPEQGWEPVRRDHIDDYVIADLERLVELPDRKGGAVAFMVRYARDKCDGFHVLATRTPSKLDASLPSRLTDDTSVAIVAWSGASASGGAFLAKNYEPEDVTDVASLIAKAKRLGCGEFLNTKLNLLSSRIAGRSSLTSVPLTIILIARRPCNIIGQNSPLEICPYIIELNSEAVDLSEKSSVRVRLASHRNTISRNLLLRASGLIPVENPKPWTLVGCGSVGSKIALHLARSGMAPDIVVDKATMSPHNYARHAVAPSSILEATDYFSKAALIANTITSLEQRAKPFQKNIALRLASAPEKTVSAMLHGTDRIVVNATGSISVRESLCLPKVRPSRGRVVEANLIGGDRLAFLSLEGPNANPSTMDLAIEAQNILSQNELHWHLAFDPAVEHVAIGQGCSSLTFPMTDARLSALTAPMAERLMEWLTSGPPTGHGEIFIGFTPQDGMGQEWFQRKIEPWLSVDDESGCEIRISASAHRKIEAAVATSPRVETGGVLMGRWSDVANAFFVVDVIPAPADSVFSRSEFRLGVQGLRGAIDDVVTKTRGAIHDIGTWHSHLSVSEPSSIDRKTADILAKEQGFPTLMLIHVPGGYRSLVREDAEELSDREI
ncbi:Mov34/MPN/PAD-1 family protein [Methylosinus sp. Ce-a6]|uniref:Mov34/MPN/PAD-1 family protein n=1 Tax=Methylosinus sp. Ce-a6 TaxID=2172005 RepID=UPI00135C74AE|nr:Mov34/MPN/PAD-1 family protein [Methylosinus sp. Ce-a6]